MADYTRFTNLEVTGDLVVKGNTANKGITKATYQSDSTKTLPTAGDSYKKSDIEAICAAIDDFRDKYDAFVAKLADGTDPS